MDWAMGIGDRAPQCPHPYDPLIKGNRGTIFAVQRAVGIQTLLAALSAWLLVAVARWKVRVLAVNPTGNASMANTRSRTKWARS